MDEKGKSKYEFVQRMNVELTPDCAKFCPLEGFESYMIIAFYELRDEKIYGAL